MAETDKKKEWIEKNREKINSYHREYRKREYAKEKRKEYYSRPEIKERQSKSCKEYRENNKNKIRRKFRVYYEENKDKWQGYKAERKKKLDEIDS